MPTYKTSYSNVGGTTIEVDFSELNQAVDRLYKMGEVRRRDIAKVFRDASRPQIQTAKRNAGKSKKGAYSLQYDSRTHPAGNLRKSIKFVTSKKFKNVYYVNAGAWYSMIYAGGHGSFAGNPFMSNAINSTETSVTNNIREGLFKLIGRSWDGR
jgi:hypothetical protein